MNSIVTASALNQQFICLNNVNCCSLKNTMTKNDLSVFEVMHDENSRNKSQEVSCKTGIEICPAVVMKAAIQISANHYLLKPATFTKQFSTLQPVPHAKKASVRHRNTNANHLTYDC